MWIGQLISKAGEAFRTYAPTELRSIGLVVKPNIPSPSLANAASAANQTKTMNKEMLALLGLAEIATEAQISAALKQLHTNATALANEQSALVTVRGELTAAQGQFRNGSPGPGQCGPEGEDRFRDPGHAQDAGSADAHGPG